MYTKNQRWNQPKYFELNVISLENSWILKFFILSIRHWFLLLFAVNVVKIMLEYLKKKKALGN